MEFMIRITLLSAIKREITRAGKITKGYDAQRALQGKDTSRSAIGWLRRGKPLEAASFPSDQTDDDSGLVT
jgi:hypothetical protein